jgi:aminoglycoside phosphotransferase (APT) family kinase protein
VEHEVDLPGGRVTPGVVRVDETVRRPTGSHSAFVHSLLTLLADSGFDYAPRFHGLDERGREVLDYLEGWVPPNLEWRRWNDEQLVEAARMVRSLHDASAGAALAGSAETICHGDLSPCNFVFVRRRPRYLIDFDRAHPDTRRSDLAYMAWAWLVGSEDSTRSTPLHDRLRQLRLVLDTYRLAEREAFAAAIQAEQREILASHERRGNAAGANWVRSEIDFVNAHADEINQAAGTATW